MPVTNTDLFIMGTVATLAALFIATSTIQDDDNKEETTHHSGFVDTAGWDHPRPGIIIEEVD